MISLPREGAPPVNFGLMPGFNIIDGAALEEAFRHPAFGSLLQEWRENGVIVVKDGKGPGVASEPDLTTYTLTEAVKKIKDCTSLDLLAAWRDLDSRKGVQNAIADQIKSLRPDGAVSK